MTASHRTCAHCRALVASWWLDEHDECPCCGVRPFRTEPTDQDSKPEGKP